MDDTWRDVKIGDIADIIGGGTPSTKDPTNFGDDIPWLTPKDLSGPHDRYIGQGERSLSKKGADNCSAKILPVGTVLLSSRAPIGYVAIAKNPISTNQGFRSLVPKQGVISEFLYYWLRGNKSELERYAAGTTFKELSGRSLSEIPILLPPEQEQRAIAHILGTLDDKIELNRRTNETLESIARALFKSWFIDFDPVRAKAEGRRPFGMDAETAALFPDEFEDSELGEIPKGWIVSRLGDFVKLEGGLSYRGDGLDIEGIPLINLGNVNPVFGYDERGIKHYSGSYKPRNLIKAGEILVAHRDITQSRRVLGTPIMVPSSLGSGPILFSLDLYAVRSDQRLPALFIYYTLQRREYRERVEGYATGTTVLSMPRETLLDFKIAVPPRPVADAFCSACEPFIHLRGINESMFATLAELRDTILPKLISGEIRIDPSKFGFGADSEVKKAEEA